MNEATRTASSAVVLADRTFDVLLTVQMMADAIAAVLQGADDKMHAEGLSGTLWAIEACLANQASKVDPLLEECQELLNKAEASAAQLPS